jgi:hypothetical protein
VEGRPQPQDRWYRDHGEIRGNALKSVSQWDGEVLSTKSKLDFNGTPIELIDRLALSADKQTLTLQRKIDTPNGVLEQSVVFERQDGAQSSYDN